MHCIMIEGANVLRILIHHCSLQVSMNKTLWQTHVAWRNEGGAINERFYRNARVQYMHAQCRVCMHICAGGDPLSEIDPAMGWSEPLKASEQTWKPGGFLWNKAIVEQIKTRSKCPLPCESCKAGGDSGGVPLVSGRCTNWCSVVGYCGSGADYETGVDCSMCMPQTYQEWNTVQHNTSTVEQASHIYGARVMRRCCA